ncbi:MAG: hypothetical protein RLZZ292_808 [Bacteroidota bacterium]|jgi:hypothetical protein
MKTKTLLFFCIGLLFCIFSQKTSAIVVLKQDSIHLFKNQNAIFLTQDFPLSFDGQDTLSKILFSLTLLFTILATPFLIISPKYGLVCFFLSMLFLCLLGIKTQKYSKSKYKKLGYISLLLGVMVFGAAVILSLKYS